MKVKVTPSKVHGNVKIPASKSMAHRALICASLSDGTSLVSNVTNSKDIEATVGCMKALGAIIKQIDGTTYEVTGTNLFKQEGNITCNANESGSTLRFLIPLAACTNAKVKFLGQGRLLQRPMDVYANEFKKQNIEFNQSDKEIQHSSKSSRNRLHCRFAGLLHLFIHKPQHRIDNTFTAEIYLPDGVCKLGIFLRKLCLIIIHILHCLRH